ncbi:hypothetical protein QTI66_23325 [Variovorax sp. J22R133]|uniref:hypothetical protein n=1 Tax=Variovorax brevis TaxID=3053503 RepID=UPI00257907C4|nr:hypothetical protein [Variovorax sp. J22R133]MDM0115100.1 hypothetical protein [Variovorax sp. J22R133]
MQDEAAAFFDAFVEAFRSFDGGVIAQRYLSPYSALHADGSIDCFASGADTARYFQRVVDGYHDQGCRSCRYRDLEVVPIGTQCALATVTWDLCRDDGSVLSTWRESYNLARVSRALRVFASIDHDTPATPA